MDVSSIRSLRPYGQKTNNLVQGSNQRAERFIDRAFDNYLVDYFALWASMASLYSAKIFVLLPVQSDSTNRFQSKFESSQNIKRRRYHDKLYLPKVNYWLFYVAKFVELVSIGRLVLASFNMASDIPEKQTFISATKGYTPLAWDLKLGPMNRNSTIRQLECNGSLVWNQQQLEGFINNRYRAFRLWNKSASLLPHKQLTYVLLPELHQAAQILKGEAMVLMLTVALTILSLGIIGGFIPLFDRYDLPSLNFIYYPEFELFKYKHQLKKYLQITRASYINHRSAPTINWWPPKDSTMGTDEIDERQQKRIAWRQSALHCYDSLNGFQVELSTPLVRGYTWRRLLLLFTLAAQAVLAMTISFTIAVLIVYILGQSPIEENIELNEIFTQGHNVSVLPAVSESCSTGQLESLVAKRIVDLVASTKKWAKDSLLVKESINIEKENVSEWRLRPAFEPTTLSGLYVPTIMVGIYLVVVYGTVFPSAFLSAMADLSFSLLNLRMKLDIGVHILRYYHNRGEVTETNEMNLSIGSNEEIEYPSGEVTRVNQLKQTYASKFTELTKTDSSPWFITSVLDRERDHSFDSGSLEIKFREALDYVLKDTNGRVLLCQRMAMKLISLDLSDNIAPRRTTNKFLISTYISMRLFEYSINQNRRALTYFVFFGTIQSSIFILPTLWLEGGRLKYGVAFAGMATANLFLVVTGFFQNQAQKIIAPIYSTLSWCILSDDPTAQHLATLWRRVVVDISSRALSKIMFRFSHIVITYATALQVSSSG